MFGFLSGLTWVDFENPLHPDVEDRLWPRRMPSAMSMTGYGF